MTNMLVLKTVFVALTLLLLAFLGMSLKILIKKNGKFQETHVGHNREM